MKFKMTDTLKSPQERVFIFFKMNMQTCITAKKNNIHRIKNGSLGMHGMDSLRLQQSIPFMETQHREG